MFLLWLIPITQFERQKLRIKIHPSLYINSRQWYVQLYIIVSFVNLLLYWHRVQILRKGDYLFLLSDHARWVQEGRFDG